MNKALLVILIILPSLALSQYKGTYETLKIREVWYVCFNALTKQGPHVDKNTHAKICDCYADKLRIRYTWEEFEFLDGLTQYKETYLMTTECMNEQNLNRREKYGGLQQFSVPRKT